MTTTNYAKHAVVRFFNFFGLDVRRHRPQAPSRASLAGGLAHLARLGFAPRTIIDAGVANATPELYDNFPNAALLLIEPLAEFEPFLRKICASRANAQYVLAAAGQAPGTADFHVHADKFGSSLLREVEGPAMDGTPRTVAVVALDPLLAEKNLPGPYLIKLDVEGVELQVLSGATETLRHTEVVVLEVSLFAARFGCPLLHDVVQFMKQSGFVAYDFLPLNYRPLDGALAQADMIFVKEDGQFRRSNAYATPEQRATHDRLAQSQFAEDFGKIGSPTDR